MRLGGASTKTTCAGGSSRVFSSALKRLAREHVDLVDDVDLEAAVDRREGDLSRRSRIVVDAAVGGGVDLDDVEGTPSAMATQWRQTPQGVVVADPRRRLAYAVQRLGEDARGAGLPGAARPGEEIGVGDPTGVDWCCGEWA